MADLREALLEKIKWFEEQEYYTGYAPKVVAAAFRDVLAAHPPSDPWRNEPNTPKAAWCECEVYAYQRHAKGSFHQPSCPMFTSAPSSHARELRVPEPFASVMEFGGRTALGLNADEIEELWRAITNEIELRIEARAAARK